MFPEGEVPLWDQWPCLGSTFSQIQTSFKIHHTHTLGFGVLWGFSNDVIICILYKLYVVSPTLTLPLNQFSNHHHLVWFRSCFPKLDQKCHYNDTMTPEGRCTLSLTSWSCRCNHVTWATCTNTSFIDGCGFPHWHWWPMSVSLPLPVKTQWLIKETIRSHDTDMFK